MIYVTKHRKFPQLNMVKGRHFENINRQI